jgi:putative flippase GtrA
LLSDAAGYAGVSVLAFALDVAILYVLVQAAGVHYLPAATCSFLAGAVLAYVLSVRFVFKYRRLSDARLECAAFVAIGIVGVVINGLVMYALVDAFGVQYLVAKVGAAAATFSANFLLRRQALFSQPGGDCTLDHS